MRLVGTLSLLLACQSPTSDGETWGPLPPGLPEPTVFPPLTADVSLGVHPDHPLLVVLEVACSTPCDLEYALSGDGVDGRAGEVVAPAGAHRLVLAGFRPDTAIEMELTFRASHGRTLARSVLTRTGVLPDFIPDIRVETPGDPGGVLLVGLREDYGPKPGPEAIFVAIDAEGEVIWFLADPARSAELPLIRRRADGTFFLTYAGRTEIVDVEGRRLLMIEQRPDDDDWHHDRLELPDGNHLVQGFELRTLVNKQGRIEVLGDTVLEYGPDNRLRNRWSALDTMDVDRFPTLLSKERLAGGYDWTHGNALELTPDGAGYLVSLRHQHWVVRIDRRSQQIDWRLGMDGDFALTAGTWFDAQHAPRFDGPDRLWVYDNGVERHRAGGPTSRVVRYRLDEVAMEAEQEWSWDLPFYTQIVGDVHPWGEGVLVTAGGRMDGTTTVWWVGEDKSVRWGIRIDGFAFRGELVPGL